MDEPKRIVQEYYGEESLKEIFTEILKQEFIKDYEEKNKCWRGERTMKRCKYKVAKYMRLSRDDGDEAESESIENQRDIIDNYIEEHKDLEVVGEYADDGFTGTNFNRPSFQKMLNDIEEGKIDCIITKDLSRFGRDHIDTGYYLERYFPSNGIRYIAIRR